jgi:hypothetical protein
MLELRIEKKGTFGAEGTMVAGNGRVALLDWILKTDCEELLQFFNPSEVLLLESNKKQVYLFGSLLICGIIVESLPTARCAPKCEKTVQALLCQNLNVKLATLLNAISSRRIRLQDDIVTSFHFSVSEIFLTGSTFNTSVELIREGLVVLRKGFYEAERRRGLNKIREILKKGPPTPKP